MSSGNTSGYNMLQPRQSQTIKPKFRNSSQNGTGVEIDENLTINSDPNGYNIDNTAGSRTSYREPSSKVILEGYRREITSSMEEANAAPKLQQSEEKRHVNDPIQIHLLSETALSDSKEYKILTQEEVEIQKKLSQSITYRIEQTKQNLAIQCKYRDATKTISKLYSPTSLDGKQRRSTARSNQNFMASTQEADQEILQSEKKCEELAAELFRLEKQLSVSQTALLKHTAGILQLTHKSSQPLSAELDGANDDYTYSNPKNGTGTLKDDFLFDERSLYRELGMLNDRDSSLINSDAQAAKFSEITTKLGKLYEKLRNTIIEIDPERENSLSSSNSIVTDDKSNEILQKNLEYLDKGISIVEQDHFKFKEQYEKLMTQLNELLEQKEVLQCQIKQQRELNNKSNATKDTELEQKTQEISRMISSQSKLDLETRLMQEKLQIVTGNLDEARKKEALRNEANESRNVDDVRKAEENVLHAQDKIRELEGIKQATLIELEDRNKNISNLREQLKTMENNHTTSYKEMQGIITELQGKVAEAESRIMSLTQELALAEEARQEISTIIDKKDSLLAQKDEEIKEKNISLVQKDTQLMEISSQKARADELLARKDNEIEEVLAGNSKEIDKLSAQKDEEINETLSKRSRDMDELLARKDREIDEAQMDIARLQTEVTIAKAELEGAYGSRSQRAAQVAANPLIQKEIDSLLNTNNELVSEIATLRAQVLEAGINNKEIVELKAQIDSLIGDNKKLVEEVVALQNQGLGTETDDKGKLEELKKELADVLEEYETMTKASIEWEKEREQFERTIDKLWDTKLEVEAQLNDEKVRWLGMRSPGISASVEGLSPANTSTTVLKNEFKRMMRDTRDENAKILRAEQAERRRLEEELRALRRMQGFGRSGSSQGFLSPV